LGERSFGRATVAQHDCAHLGLLLFGQLRAPGPGVGVGQSGSDASRSHAAAAHCITPAVRAHHANRRDHSSKSWGMATWPRMPAERPAGKSLQTYIRGSVPVLGPSCRVVRDILADVLERRTIADDVSVESWLPGKASVSSTRDAVRAYRFELVDDRAQRSGPKCGRGCWGHGRRDAPPGRLYRVPSVHEARWGIRCAPWRSRLCRG
jgi:hypothetical protein